MFRPFVEANKIVMSGLTKNPHPRAIEVLQDYHGRDVDYGELASNETPGAISLMMERTGGNLNSLQIQQLSSNPSDEALDLLLSGEIPINWISFSANTNSRALEHLKDNREKISWKQLNTNNNPMACDFLEPSRVCPLISLNTSDRAMDILNSMPENIFTHLILSNPNPKALEIVKKRRLLSNELYSSPIFMNQLAKNTNPEAIDLLTQNLERFHWKEIFSNPSPKAVELITSCYDGSLKKYCRFMSLDTIGDMEERLQIAKSDWASDELCKNTNPDVIGILPRLNYDLLSENPIIFK